MLAAAALAVTLLFALSPLDVAAARLFYRPGASDPWPLAAQAPWPLLYRAAPWITAFLVAAGLALLVGGALARSAGRRRQGVFLLLAVVLGPGLLGNVVLKDHWKRPRPREIAEFGGAMRYVPAPLPGREGGASFPCGHCTVGFLYGIGWWIWRRRPVRAAASLSAGLLAGGVLGLGRMAAGAHFLSDVLWSFLLAAGVSHVLWFHVLHVPREESPHGAQSAGPPAKRQNLATTAAILGAAGVLAALFAAPHGRTLDTAVSFSLLPRAPRILKVEARKANVEITLVDEPAAELTVRGELHGFGLPFGRLDAHAEMPSDSPPTLVYRIEQRGFFTDLDAFASLRVPAAGLERVIVRIGAGDIRVTDATRAGVVSSGALRLDVSTGAGHVRAPGVR